MEATERHVGLLGRLIAVCAGRPWTTVILVACLAAWGTLALRRTPLDAIPDLSETQVIVFTEWPGQSPDLVEAQITYPISTALLSAPRVRVVRGQSMFGMSFVYAIFDDGTDIYWARSRVLEYLAGVRGELPEGIEPTLGPDATGVGWVFQYALVDRTGRHDLADLRALQDYRLRYALESVPGVAEVAPVGGFVKEYQILLDPQRLLAYRVTLRDVIEAVRASNEDAGGRALEIAGHEHMIRGRGYVRELRDLETIPVALGEGGVPVLVRDVGVVAFGPEPRRGVGELNGEGETVGAIVVMRYGENALEVIEAIEARLDELRTTLPEGVEIVVTYDRSELIEDAIRTLRRTLVEEMLVVSVIIFVFLLHVRSALVPILTLPVAVLLAFIPMSAQGLTADIMSLGGIAVAIGAMVDASIILLENVHKKLEAWEDEGRPTPRTTVVVTAMQEVGPSIFFSLLVITIAFLPVFTLEATEGRMFKPLAFTKTYSMGFAALLAVTLTPALVAIFVRGKILREDANPLNRVLIALYAPVVRLVVRRRWFVVVVSLLAMLATVPAFLRLESEFMPPLHEGVLLYMPTAPPGMSAGQAAEILERMDAQLMQFPEVQSVWGKMGRAETATDPAPMGMAETVVVLKPRAEWREGLTWEGLVHELDAALQYPGMPNLWWMPIQTRTEMLATGVRSPLGIRIHGNDLAEIERAALQIERAVADIPGTRSAFAERSTGGFYLDIAIDRPRAARYGLRVADLHDAVRSAIGAAKVSEVVKGRERYPITVSYAREYREDPDALARVLVATPGGAQIPLGEVATITFASGPPMLRSEDGQLVGYVFVDTDRPIASYVADARAIVAALDLPPGVRVAWAGQFEYLERAQEKLTVVVPVTLVLVVFLLYWNTGSVIETTIVMLAVPFSLIGAIWLLYLLDYHMSVAVWVGLIALAGLDAETGVVMLLYLTLAHDRRRATGRLHTPEDLEAAIVEGAAQRIRPKLMTVATTMIGLVPVLWSDGTGADVMKRIAAPMVGGLVSSFLLELTVYPAVFAIWKRRELRRERATTEAPPISAP